MGDGGGKENHKASAVGSEDSRRDDFPAVSVMSNSMSMSKPHPKAACLSSQVPLFARKFSPACDCGSLVPTPSSSQGGGYEDQAR